MIVQVDVSLVLASHFSVLRVIGLRRAEQRLKRDKGGPDRQRWGPFVLQDIEADGTGLGADVRVPDFSVELHLGRFEWVVGRDVDIDVEDAAFVAGVFGAENLSFPVAQVISHDFGLDDELAVCLLDTVLELLELFHNSPVVH